MNSLEGDPFGEKPVLWWRSLFLGKTGRAPKRYARAAGAVGPAILFLWGGGGLDRPMKVLIGAFLLLAPPWLLEVWWRGRERRREERLLIK